MLRKFDKFLPSGYKNKLHGNDLTAFERKNLTKRIIKDIEVNLSTLKEELDVQESNCFTLMIKMKLKVWRVKPSKKLLKRQLNRISKLKELEI